MKFLCEGIAPEIVEVARRELGESEEIKRKTLKELKNLIKGEKDFYPCPEDLFLTRFLRAGKFDVNKAFKKLQNFYKYKAKKSGKITDFKASDLKEILKYQTVFVLDDRDKNGAVVAIVRVGEFYLEEYPPELFLAVGIVLIEFALLNETSQICGYDLVIDIGGMTTRRFQRLASLSFAYNFVHSLQDVMPTRIRSIHVINVPIYFHIFIKTCVLFLSEKLRKRLYVHGISLGSFHKHISREILPAEYDGKLGPLSEQADKIADLLISFDDHFEKMNKYGYQGETLEKLKKSYSL